MADWQPNRARGKVQMCMKHLKFHILFTYLINMTINMNSGCLNCFLGGWGGPTPWEGDLCSRRTIVPGKNMEKFILGAIAVMLERQCSH